MKFLYKYLINFFYIAKGSCGEVKSQLYIAFDNQYIDVSRFREGLRLCDETSRLTQSFIEKVKQKGQMGIQYKIPKKRDGYAEWLKKEFPETYRDLKSKNLIK